MTLQDKLDDITAQTRNLVQPERLELSERAIAELFATGIEDKLLKPGEAAPAFALPDANGKLVRSADLLALGPLVVCFFRGRWCPYCVTELETWRDLFPAVRERGALLVAISPQTVRQNDFTVTQHTLPFPLLRDEGAAVAAEFRRSIFGAGLHAELLPVDPGEYSVYQRRAVVAFAGAGDVCDRPGRGDSLVAGTCRFPRASGTDGCA